MLLYLYFGHMGLGTFTGRGLGKWFARLHVSGVEFTFSFIPRAASPVKAKLQCRMNRCDSDTPSGEYPGLFNNPNGSDIL